MLRLALSDPRQVRRVLVVGAAVAWASFLTWHLRRRLRKSVRWLSLEDAEKAGRSRPYALRRLDVGRCSSLWSEAYLMTRLQSLKVSVHVSSSAWLDFNAKNFAYEVMPFPQFVVRARQKGRYHYYRALHSKRNQAASLESLGLGADFQLPKALDGVRHSTVLRVASAGLRMWLHYDTLDNVLVCVRGRKRVLLFPPWHLDNLYVQGSSSAVGSRLLSRNPCALRRLFREFPLLAKAWDERADVTLNEGDALFIPALWFHSTEALSSGGLCVSVNAFAKHEDAALYDKKDIFGNRDLLPAQEALKVLEERVFPLLQQLPAQQRAFCCSKARAMLSKEG